MRDDDFCMNGKTCVVTGATSGIGYVTARELARRGARVLVVGREPDRARTAVEQIRHETGREAIPLAADLSRMAAVRELARSIRDQTPRLDVLVNNAGGLFPRRLQTPDGLEMTFALNHLAYWILTLELHSLLVSSAPARIVCVASEAHRGVTLDFDDLQSSKSYLGFRAYQRSKLANILFTRSLARRLEGTGVTCNCLHPGVVRTNIFRESGWLNGLARLAVRFALTPEQGARTSVYLACSQEVEGATGGYYVKERLATPSPAALDDQAARRLWEASIQISGVDAR